MYRRQVHSSFRFYTFVVFNSIEYTIWCARAREHTHTLIHISSDIAYLPASDLSHLMFCDSIKAMQAYCWAIEAPEIRLAARWKSVLFGANKCMRVVYSKYFEQTSARKRNGNKQKRRPVLAAGCWRQSYIAHRGAVCRAKSCGKCLTLKSNGWCYCWRDV